MFFKILRWTRTIRLLLSGIKREPDEFWLFRIKEKPDLRKIYDQLILRGYQYNYMSLTSYRDQVFQVRKLLCYATQIHIRIYKDGWVTAHQEYTPEYDFKRHWKGVDCNPLTRKEALHIGVALEV